MCNGRALQIANHHCTEKQHRLNEAMAALIDDFSLVRFTPLDSTDEDSVAAVLAQADHCLQYGEEEEPREPQEYEPADADNADADADGGEDY
jgi:hypothetical protein